MREGCNGSSTEQVDSVPALRGFRDLEDSTLRKIHVGGPPVITQTWWNLIQDLEMGQNKSWMNKVVILSENSCDFVNLLRFT